MFPRLFQIGSFYLPTYGVLVAIGVLLGLWISVRNSEKQGINGDDAWNLGIFVVLAGIIGAKILYVINDWSSYANNWREIFSLNTLQAGGVFSGGLIAALVDGRLVYAAPSHAGRCAPWTGSRPDWPLGMCSGASDAFQPDAVTANRRIISGASSSPILWRISVSGTPLGVRIEPTQLIEAAAEFFNFLFLMLAAQAQEIRWTGVGHVHDALRSRALLHRVSARRSRRGEVFGGIMTGTQLISILLVIGGGLIWWLKSGSPQPSTGPESAPSAQFPPHA